MSLPACGHKYCPADRCGYMPDLSVLRYDRNSISTRIIRSLLRLMLRPLG